MNCIFMCIHICRVVLVILPGILDSRVGFVSSFLFLVHYNDFNLCLKSGYHEAAHLS